MAADEGTSDAGWRWNSQRDETPPIIKPHTGPAARPQDSVVVDVASVAQCHDDDQRHVVSDGVDNPVVADANAEAGPPPRGRDDGGRGSSASRAMAP